VDHTVEELSDQKHLQEVGPSPHKRRAGYTQEQHSLLKKLFSKSIEEHHITIEDIGVKLRQATEDERSTLSQFSRKQIYDKIRSMFKKDASQSHSLIM
jgi:hypothetical protein